MKRHPKIRRYNLFFAPFAPLRFNFNSCNSWTLVFLSSEEQEEHERENNADYDAGGYGEVEGNVLLLDNDIARQPSTTGDLADEVENGAG